MIGSSRNLTALTEAEFDVLIIGGGISGAWLALHASRSGYRTVLVEQQDFASQTSSSSSKLLHGGIRYLQQLQFGKVRESALERAQYIYAAPHLSHAVPFLIPTYRDFARSKFFLRCGMLAYRLLTLGENKIIEDPAEAVPSDSSLNRGQLEAVLELGDEPHTGAVKFYERHMHNSERMVLSVLRTAEDSGATLLNYCQAKHLVVDDRKVTGANLVDRLTGQSITLKSRLVINAAGPWIDELNSPVNQKPAQITGFAIGSHLITRQLSDHAIALTTKQQSDAKLDRGGRHIFVIPWNGYSLIGTSYNEISAPGRDLLPTNADVQQLLSAVNEALPTAALSASDVISGYSGLYPLRTENIKSAVYQGTGEYVIIDHSQADRIDGLVTALGAKFTTGRKLSALTMRLACKKLGGQIELGKVRLHDSQYQHWSEFTRRKQLEYEGRLPRALIEHLLRLYGSKLDDIVALIDEDASLQQPIAENQPDILAQAIYAVRCEHAATLQDVLFRRTAVGFLGITQDDLERVADKIAPLLGWSTEDIADQIADVNTRLKGIEASLGSERT